MKATTSKGIYGGMQERMSNTAVGQLLLSTVDKQRREGMLRRMNAEAAPEDQFCFSDMAERVYRAGDRGQIVGRMGFGSIADVCAVLIPDVTLERPMALGIVYEPGANIDHENLLEMLREAVSVCAERPHRREEQAHPFSHAA